jgi:endonuclease/exonuclease/phosphatase family metal-dependent hydrolase
MKRSRVGSLILVALIVLFGLQTFRVFLPIIIWYGGQWMSPEQMALYALGAFALTMLAPLLRRFLNERTALAITAGGVVLVRIGIQLFRTPEADLALATAGLALWGCFLPLWHASPRNRAEDGPPFLAAAFPLALLLDTTVRSLLLAYDLAWCQGAWANLVVLLLGGLALLLLRWEIDAPKAKEATGEPPLTRVLPLLGLGPWLYLNIAVTQNPAALNIASGWNDLMTHLVVNAVTVVGAMLSFLAATGVRRRRRLWALLPGGFLVAALILHYLQVEPRWLWFLVASLAAWAELGFLLTGTLSHDADQPGLWRTALAAFLALLTMLVAIFLIAQFHWQWLIPVMGAIVGLTSFWAARPALTDNGPRGRSASLALVAGIAWVVLAGIGILMRWASPMVDKPPTVGPVRVMTYNIHQGINADLKMDLEAITDAIVAQSPDVVVLNEVNRARAVNGFADTLPTISRRLGMPYVFGANYPDGQYGNALLSRYPVLEWSNTHFTYNTTEVRGVLRVTLDTPGRPMTFFATHLDHLEEPDNAREEQVAEMLALWDGARRSILLGDLNATPETAEIEAIYNAGLVDVLAEMGQEDVFTFWDPIPTPGRRIDYIFVTPDLAISRAAVIETRASDHLPVLAEVGP